MKQNIVKTLLVSPLVICALLATGSANAALVAYFPVNSSTDSRTILDDVIDDASHAVTNGATTTGSTTHTYIVNDSFRSGDVLSTIEGHRYSAGTQNIDLNVGFTWSLWVNVNSSNSSDTGEDSIIGTRAASGGAWHKMDLNSTQSWNGNVPGTGNYTGGTLADNTWHFITYVGDTTNRRIYKDGVLIGEDTNFTVATFNGNMEIGGTAQFSEDVTGLYDEIGIWNERLTVDEMLSLYDVTSPGSLGGLLYDTLEFESMKNIHDAGTGSVTIDGVEWTYATGLTESAGLTISGLDGVLVLDDTAGTGLFAANLIPEPSTGLLLMIGLGALALLRRRR